MPHACAKVQLAAPSPRQRVRFSKHSQMFLFPHNNLESSQKRCTSLERQRFKQSLLRDIHQMRQVLQNTPLELITQETLQECIGIETFIQPEMAVAERVVQMKQAHVHRVLSAQRLLRGRGSTEKQDAISQVSKLSSGWSRTRAEKLATGYAEKIES